MSEICLRNARLVLPGRIARGWIVLTADRIAAWGEGHPAGRGGQDCAGDLVMPGLIELHTDNVERHLEPRPGTRWPVEPALLAHDAELAVCGITTVFDALRVGSNPSMGGTRERPYARPLASALRRLQASGALRIRHALHLRAELCSETLEAEIDDFTPDDEVGIVSIMDHTPGERQFRDLSALRAWFTPNEDGPQTFDAHVARLREISHRNAARHARAAMAHARRLGAIVASHDDTTPDQVETSHDRGVRLAEFPTTEAAAAACQAAGIAVMMGAPNLVRGGSHSGNVAAGDLAQSGLLDILSSDYVPAALLPAAFHLGRLWDDLARGLATVTQNPADAAGLADRGRIAEGAVADLIRVGLADDAPLVRETWVAGRRVA